MGKLVDVHSIVEKPTQEYARKMLGIPNLPTDEFLTIFGTVLPTTTVKAPHLGEGRY